MKNLKIAAAGIAVCIGMLFTACSAAETEFKHSTVDESGKYTCEVLGIGADFDTDIWTFYTDSEIAAANGASSASDEDLKAALKKNAGLQDMMAMQEDGTNIMLVYEDTNASRVGNISEDAYISSSMEMLEEQLKGMFDNISSKKTTVTVAGTSHTAADISGESYGVPVYSRYIAIRNGNLVGLLTINAFSSEEIDEITGMFYAL